MRLILLLMMRLNPPECILCVNLLQSNHALNNLWNRLINLWGETLKMRLLMDRVSPSKCISENTSGYTWVDISFFWVSLITVLRDVYIYSQNFKWDDFEFCLRCHWQCECHQTIHRMCIVLMWNHHCLLHWRDTGDWVLQYCRNIVDVKAI